MAYYYFDLSVVHGLIFIVPCIILTLFKLWTKLVAKTQAEIITRKLNEELVKLVWSTQSAYDKCHLLHWINQEEFWYTQTSDHCNESEEMFA